MVVSNVPCIVAHWRSRMKTLLKMLLPALLLCTTNGCATGHGETGPKEVRQHMKGMSGVHLATGALAYIFFVPPAQAHDAVETVLRKTFTVSRLRKQQKSALEQYNIFSDIGTDFFYYEDKGKKYRKKCEATVYVIPRYPDYSKVVITCVFDVYELGLTSGRGGIHNLFTQWWDWYPENGLYVAEDLLELVYKELKLVESEVIRLNKKDFYSREEILELIGTAKKTK